MLPDRLNQWANTNADIPCLFYGEQDFTVSYQQFNRLCKQTASGLSKLGVKKGERISVLSNNAFITTVAMFSSWKLGALYCPINNRYKGELLAYIINDTQPKVLIADQYFVKTLNSISAQIDCVPYVVVHQPKPDDHDYDKNTSLATITDLECIPLATLQNEADAGPEVTLTGSDPACIIYTSGTTGNPKGVVQNHQWLSACCSIVDSGEPEKCPALHPLIVYNDLPLYHVGGMVYAVCQTIWSGGQLALWDAFSPSQFWSRIKKSGATFARFIDVMMDWLMQMPESPTDGDNTLFMVAMTPLPDYHHKLAERFGIDLVVAGYGSTELGTGFFSLIDELGDKTGSPLAAKPGVKQAYIDSYRRIHPQAVVDGTIAHKKGYLGVPNPSMDIKILNAKGNPVAPNEPGQAHFKPKLPGLMFSEYFNKPEKTQEAVQGGWYCPADMLSVDENGIYYFEGRQQGFLRVRGENISCDAIEMQLDRHPAIDRSAVVGIPADQGEGDDVVAFVQCKASSAITEADFRHWIELELPKFMWPKHIRFVREFPLTGTYKIEKHKLQTEILHALAEDRLHV